MFRLIVMYVGLFGVAALGLWLGPSDQTETVQVSEAVEAASVVEAPAPVDVADLSVTQPLLEDITRDETVTNEPLPIELEPTVVAEPLPQISPSEIVVEAKSEAVVPEISVAIVDDPVPADPAPNVVAPVEIIAQDSVEVPEVAEAAASEAPEVVAASTRPEPAPEVIRAVRTAPVSAPASVANENAPEPRLPLAPVIEALMAQAALEVEGRGIYVVQPGDSLLSIARNFYGDSDAHRQIFEANRDQLPSIDAIQTGQTLRLP